MPTMRINFFKERSRILIEGLVMFTNKSWRIMFLRKSFGVKLNFRYEIRSMKLRRFVASSNLLVNVSRRRQMHIYNC